VASSQVISAPDEITRDAQVALDKHGDATVVWTHYSSNVPEGPDVVEAATRPESGGWSVPQVISPSGKGVIFPQVAVDQSGDAAAVWERRVGGHTGAVEAASRVAGDAWQVPQALSPSEDIFLSNRFISLKFHRSLSRLRTKPSSTGTSWPPKVCQTVPKQQALRAKILAVRRPSKEKKHYRPRAREAAPAPRRSTAASCTTFRRTARGRTDGRCWHMMRPFRIGYHREGLLLVVERRRR
jgi:hypothetical protein